MGESDRIVVGLSEGDISDESKYVSVTLSVLGWHLLLKDLEFLLSVKRGADNNNTRIIWEDIMKQLNGISVNQKEEPEDGN